MIAGELISKSVLPLKITDQISVAIDLFQDQKLNELPVVDGFSFWGLVSESDLIVLEGQPITLSEVENLFKKISISPELHIFEVFETFINKKTSLIPVVGENSKYLGSIVKHELTETAGKLLSADNPGGIIEIEVHENDYMLSEIARIVEYNDAKILSSYIELQPERKLLEITLKINKIDIEPVLQTFDRYGYKVVRSYSGDETNSLVKERFESLMKYLEI